MRFQTSAERLPSPLPPGHFAGCGHAVRARVPLAEARPSPNHVHPTLTDLIAVPAGPWKALHARAIEPNGYYDPDWAVAVARHARGHGGAQALLAWDPSNQNRLTGLLPVRWSRQAMTLPLPMLVAWSGYAPLTVPALDRDCAQRAAGALLDAAREQGARALLLPTVAIEGAAFDAVRAASSEQGLSIKILRRFQRAGLDASQDADTALHSALGGKKLKELRRQRRRLEDTGALLLKVSTTPAEVAAALECFLLLEQKGWKGLCGTSLGQDEGNAAFIRKAAIALAERARFEIVSLTRAGTLIASGLILRDADRAYFLKIAIDEDESRASPGVQLTLDITRHLCADTRVAFADSLADSEHPMIDRVWRARIEIADVFITLRPRDPVAHAIRNLVMARYAAIDCVRTLRRMKEKLK